MSRKFDVAITAERACTVVSFEHPAICLHCGLGFSSGQTCTDACRVFDCFGMQMLVDNYSSTCISMHKEQPLKEWLMEKRKSGR